MRNSYRPQSNQQLLKSMEEFEKAAAQDKLSRGIIKPSKKIRRPVESVDIWIQGRLPLLLSKVKTCLLNRSSGRAVFLQSSLELIESSALEGGAKFYLMDKTNEMLRVNKERTSIAHWLAAHEAFQATYKAWNSLVLSCSSGNVKNHQEVVAPGPAKSFRETKQTLTVPDPSVAISHFPNESGCQASSAATGTQAAHSHYKDSDMYAHPEERTDIVGFEEGGVVLTNGPSTVDEGPPRTRSRSAPLDTKYRFSLFDGTSEGGGVEL